MFTRSIYESIPRRYPELQGQVAIVTGSSRGIGKGTAQRLAREGMRIVLHGYDAAELKATADEFRALNLPVAAVHADFSKTDAVDVLFEGALKAFGTVDLLVNNAADLRRTSIFNVDTALLDHQLAVNLRAPYLAAQRAAEIMLPKKHGNIVSISSVGGARAHWDGLPYDVTKGGIDAMTRAMALDLANEGIRVNAIAPGAILVDRGGQRDEEVIRLLARRVPADRFGTPLEIGAAVAFLASDDAAYITGHILFVDGGLTAQLSGREYPI
jgi:NAD(P)-dependent dehydrogenase (short-subunit alcohol dehydrogenase family)